MLTEAGSVERKNVVGDGLSFLERRSRSAADCCWLFQDPGSENCALNSLLHSNLPGQSRKAFWLTFITTGGKCLPVYSLSLSFSLLKWKCSDKTWVGLWEGVGTLSEDGPFPHCHVSLCKYKTFPQSWWEYLSCFIDSQGTEPGRGAKEWISPFFELT